MKRKNINSVKVQFTALMSLKNEALTFIPKLKEDPINGEIYVSHVFCLEQSKDFNIPPFLPVELLPGYFQTLFAPARIIVNPPKD